MSKSNGIDLRRKHEKTKTIGSKTYVLDLTHDSPPTIVAPTIMLFFLNDVFSHLAGSFFVGTITRDVTRPSATVARLRTKTFLRPTQSSSVFVDFRFLGHVNAYSKREECEYLIGCQCVFFGFSATISSCGAVMDIVAKRREVAS